MSGPHRQRELARFAGDSDEDLLAYMAMKDDPSCRAAAGAFHDRHKEFLFAVLKKRRVGDVVGGDEALADLVQNTFWTAYQKADTYRPCGSADPDRQRRACRAWLVGICRNLIRDALTRPVSVVSDVALDDCIELGVDVREGADTDPTLVAAADEAFDKLSEREQEVVRTTMMFYKPGEKNQRLPNSVSQNLASQFSTTPENIRAIRKRAFDKLRAHLAPWATAKRR
jgi:RNA polymerase sigma factor (sigma-70 family)